MITRREWIASTASLAAGATLPRLALAEAGSGAPIRRAIPASGEQLPVIGLGTWQTFDVGADAAARGALAEVLGRFVALGGTLVDSSPMYGRAESVLGDLAAAQGLRERLLLATKVWTQGRAAGMAQMEESLRRLHSPHIELMQVHNLVDWRQHLPVLREWKAQGRICYLGISHYTSSAYAEVEAVLRAEKLDFLQINYSAQERQAARRLLPLAQARGVAVLVNRPFGGGGLLRRLHTLPLPSWASDIGCTTWPQILLKFVLSHPAVTCAIPGSGNAAHMAENAAAGSGSIPPPEFWHDKDALHDG